MQCALQISKKKNNNSGGKGERGEMFEWKRTSRTIPRESSPFRLYCEKSRASGTRRRVRLTARHFSANGISLYPGEENPSVLVVHDDAASCSFTKSLVASPPSRAFSPCWLRSQLHMVNLKSLLAV